MTTNETRLLEFGNLKTFCSKVHQLVDLKVLNLNADCDDVTISQALEKIERKYVTKYIQSLLNSESMRLFDFLKLRAELVYTQVYNKHIV